MFFIATHIIGIFVLCRGTNVVNNFFLLDFFGEVMVNGGCDDVMKHFTPQDHYDKREDLGNCFETAQQEDPENLLLGFLKEFGDGFDLG